jgi:hypothetical protein
MAMSPSDRFSGTFPRKSFMYLRYILLTNENAVNHNCN